MIANFCWVQDSLFTTLDPVVRDGVIRHWPTDSYPDVQSIAGAVLVNLVAAAKDAARAVHGADDYFTQFDADSANVNAFFGGLIGVAQDVMTSYNEGMTAAAARDGLSERGAGSAAPEPAAAQRRFHRDLDAAAAGFEARMGAAPRDPPPAAPPAATTADVAAATAHAVSMQHLAAQTTLLTRLVAGNRSGNRDGLGVDDVVDEASHLEATQVRAEIESHLRSRADPPGSAAALDSRLFAKTSVLNSLRREILAAQQVHGPGVPYISPLGAATFVARYHGEGLERRARDAAVRDRLARPPSAVGWLSDVSGFWLSHAIIPEASINFMTVFAYMLFLIKLQDQRSADFAQAYDSCLREYIRQCSREGRSLSLEMALRYPVEAVTFRAETQILRAARAAPPPAETRRRAPEMSGPAPPRQRPAPESTARPSAAAGSEAEICFSHDVQAGKHCKKHARGQCPRRHLDTTRPSDRAAFDAAKATWLGTGSAAASSAGAGPASRVPPAPPAPNRWSGRGPRGGSGRGGGSAPVVKSEPEPEDTDRSGGKRKRAPN